MFDLLEMQPQRAPLCAYLSTVYPNGGETVNGKSAGKGDAQSLPFQENKQDQYRGVSPAVNSSSGGRGRMTDTS